MPMLLFLALLPFSASASDLGSYLVFADSAIQSQKSDYQGETGARGEINLENFFVKGNLQSSAAVAFSSGSVQDSVSAPRVYLSRANAARARFTPKIERKLTAAGADLKELARRLSLLPATAHAEYQQKNKTLFFSASKPVEVFDIDARELDEAHNLTLEGNGRAMLLVRVHGEELFFKKKGTFVTKGLAPRNIVFFFPEAKTLVLSLSGGAVSPENGRLWGVPGSVVAPKADVYFSEILVTGKLYARQILTPTGRAGGQVNFGESDLIDDTLDNDDGDDGDNGGK